MRKSVAFATLLAIMLLFVSPTEALACPSCYGAISDTEVAGALQLAMLTLIGTTAMIGTGVVMFFSNIKKREARIAADNQDASTDA